MKKLYEKNELTFALVWIGLYVGLLSLANFFSDIIGIEFSAHAILNALLTVSLFLFIKKNGLMQKYGLCKTNLSAGKFLWYIPLILLASHNLWNGVVMNLAVAGTVCYIFHMICVGFMEEVIFRGLLFKAIAKDNVKEAIIISSVTFGAGHIVNLFNGSGMDLVSNLLQVIGAIAIGFLFVTIFHRGGSLVSCIITHSAIDVASVFANGNFVNTYEHILFTLSRLVIVVGYTLVLLKTLPRTEAAKQ